MTPHVTEKSEHGGNLRMKHDKPITYGCSCTKLQNRRSLLVRSQGLDRVRYATKRGHDSMAMARDGFGIPCVVCRSSLLVPWRREVDLQCA
jgi:hypothetical protein